MQISSDRQEPDTQRWALFAHITILSRRSSSLSAILTFWIHWSLFVLKFDDHLNKTNGGRWWKRRWGMVRMAWVPKKRELASIGVSPPHFLQHNGANIPPRAHPPCVRTIKSKGWSIFKVGASPWYRWDIKWGLWYRGMSGASLILGDIGVARTGYRGRSCLWYPPLVSTVVSTPPTGGRKQGAKAHFSLSRFGDYPISLTLTSLTGPAELDTIHF